MVMVKIYTLKHKSSNKIYVGKTKNELKKRLSSHMSDLRGVNRKTNWIKSLKKRNFIPEICLIEEVDDGLANEREIYWIAEYRKKYGIELILNTSNGGDGGSLRGTKKSAETRRKMSLAAMGNKNGLGIKRDKSVGVKISLAKKGKPFSKKHIKNLTIALRAKSQTKLNEQKVYEIREKYIPYRYDSIMLGLEYGVSSGTIRKIVNNKRWVKKVNNSGE